MHIGIGFFDLVADKGKTICALCMQILDIKKIFFEKCYYVFMRSKEMKENLKLFRQNNWSLAEDKKEFFIDAIIKKQNWKNCCLITVGIE